MTSTARDAAITTTWPSGFNPDAAGPRGFAVREVPASADAVFAWLRRVDLHPAFYGGLMGLTGVRHKAGGWPELAEGSRLSFALGRLPIPAVKVVECDPDAHRLAWAGNGPGLSAVHAWTVKPTGEATCLLRSEEKWTGALAVAIGPVTGWRLQQVQSHWADAVTAAATAHPQGPPAAA